MAVPVDVLRRVPLLSGLQDDELMELAARFRERVYDAGAPVVTAARPARGSSSSPRARRWWARRTGPPPAWQARLLRRDRADRRRPPLGRHHGRDEHALLGHRAARVPRLRQAAPGGRVDAARGARQAAAGGRGRRRRRRPSAASPALATRGLVDVGAPHATDDGAASTGVALLDTALSDGRLRIAKAEARGPGVEGSVFRDGVEDGRPALEAAPAAARLGTALRAVRMQRNLSQSELARLLGISPSAVSQAERGRRGLSLETLLDACTKLDLTLDELLRGDVNPRLPARPPPRSPPACGRAAPGAARCRGADRWSAAGPESTAQRRRPLRRALRAPRPARRGSSRARSPAARGR